MNKHIALRPVRAAGCIVSRELVEKDGWSVLPVGGIPSTVCAHPAASPIVRGQGQAGWFGWWENARAEDLAYRLEADAADGSELVGRQRGTPGAAAPDFRHPSLGHGRQFIAHATSLVFFPD